MKTIFPEGNFYTWVLHEAAKLREIKQAYTGRMIKAQREEYLKHKQPLWDAMDQKMAATEERLLRKKPSK